MHCLIIRTIDGDLNPQYITNNKRIKQQKTALIAQKLAVFLFTNIPVLNNF